MDDFNNSEQTNENTESGNLSGFDSVNDIPESEKPQGYTVTPDGGYYNRQKDEIIQDSVEPQTTPENAYADTGNTDNEPPFTPPVYQQNYSTQPPKTDFRPNGTYGGYAPNHTSDQSTNFNQGSTPNYTRPAGNSFTNPYTPSGFPKQSRKPAKSGGHSTATVIIAALLAAVIGAISGIAAIKLTSDDSTVDFQNGTSQNVNINVDESVTSVAEAVAQKVTPSVVGIRTTCSVTNFFFGNSESSGEGSGVVYSSDGYIITNYHVIENAAESSNSKIEVFLSNSKEKSYEASIIGYNISSDLAVIKINVNGLVPVELGDSSKLKVGQYVVTIGSPGGLEFMGSTTYGIISGLDRTVSSNSQVKLIQTDAAINPGNSGGALLDTNGRLIGINSSKIVAEEFEGMGFAIPVNLVVEKCKNIISRKDSPEPYIGITVSEKYTAEVLDYYGYPSGAVVLSVDDGSPADDAGIKRGDIVTEFDGTEITEYTVLNDLLNDSTPGKNVSIKIYRSGRYYTTNIKIGSNNK